ncbi:MAG: amino acid adenylation domain-containing protein, partial [bacterium]|nr:amino acid adenylation domain-containing protein [bacterium]
MTGKKYSEELAIAAGQSLKEREYWLKKLAGELEVSRFYYDNRCVETGETKTAPVELKIQQTPELAARLIKISKGSDYTLFMLLVAGLVVLLDKYCGEKDILVGAPIDKQEIEGDYINTVLVLRNTMEEGIAFRELLMQVKQTIIEAAENQNYPFDTLLYDLKRGAAQSDLFEVCILLENIHEKRYISHLQNNVTFCFSRTGESIRLNLEYNRVLYREATMERIAAHYNRLLQEAVFNIQKPIENIEIVSEEEKQKLLYEFNSTVTERPAEKTIDALFRIQAKKTPGSLALIGPTAEGSGTITYEQLDERTRQLAGQLRAQGVKPGIIVGILAQRSVEMIIAMIAVLKAGGAYLPLDPEYPGERIDYMLRDSSAHLLLTRGQSCPNLAYEGPRQDLLDPRESPTPAGTLFEAQQDPNRIAYLIYTSGSTGEPKGVVIEHNSITNTLTWRRKYYRFTTGDAILQVPSFSFDSSVEDIFTPLISGSTLILIKQQERYNLSYLQELIEENKVTHFLMVPSLYRSLLREIAGNLETLRAVTVAGDNVTGELVEEHFRKLKHVELYNEYGPTENSVCSTVYRFDPQDPQESIGKPIDNVTCIILDTKGKLCPIGVPGELCLSGAGLARHYLNRPKLTEERFVPNPYLPDQQMYRTGDLARWQPGGNIDFLGRIDRQVKIRGFRIEPGEIENQMQTHPSILEAAVITGDPGEDGTTGDNAALHAYIVIQNEITAADIRDYLLQRLPDHMIPVQYIQLAEMPRTPTGKIDRKLLPFMKNATAMKAEYIPPRNDTEKKLTALWMEILKTEQIGIKDNFFNTGGDSIKTISLLNTINQEFQANLKVVDLYQNETIEKFAAIINKNQTETAETKNIEVRNQMQELKERITAENIMPEGIEDIYPLSNIENGMLYYTLKNTTTIYHNQRVSQLKDKNFDEKILKRALELLVRKHTILRSGYSMHEYEEPVHIVYRYKEELLHYRHEDITHMNAKAHGEYINEALEKDSNTPFKFNGRTPLWRAQSYRLDKENICFVWICHHAILDGWSTATLMAELNHLYIRLKEDPEYGPRPLKGDYKTFVIEQILQTRERETAVFWKRELEDYKRYRFPERKETQEDPSTFKRIARHLDITRLQKLKKTSQNYDTSVKDLCFAAYLYMLNSYSYENDILAGLVTNNRPVCEDADKIIGCFLNTVPVRMKIPGRITWQEYIAMVKDKLLELKKYDRLSLFEIVRHMGEKAGEK